MYRNFIQLVSETVDEAHSKGIELFYESLEHSLNKDSVLNEHGLEKTLTSIFEATTEPAKDEVEEIKE